jgi:hypothetical protein
MHSTVHSLLLNASHLRLAFYSNLVWLSPSLSNSARPGVLMRNYCALLQLQVPLKRSNNIWFIIGIEVRYHFIENV